MLAHLQPGAAPIAEVPADQWNPFDPYSPALGSNFAGRTEELRLLQQAMETGHSVSVVGEWRIGKTSLLAAFADRARASLRVVRQMTGEGPEGASLPAFVTQATGQRGSDEPDAAANQLSEWAEAQRKDGQRPVLIVDEVERLIETFEHRFFERLRGMLERLMIVFCSRRGLDQVYRGLRRTSPFGNRLELVRLALLDSPAAEHVLSWGNGVLQPEDGSMILEWAGRHPYFVQLMARELVEVRVNGLPVDKAIDRFYDASATRLRELWDTLSDRDREQLSKAAAGIPATRRALRLRGLVNDDGTPFGRIVREWLSEEQP